MPREARTELETTVDYYADLFVPFLKVCQGKESFVQVREFIDEIYSFLTGCQIYRKDIWNNEEEK